MITPTYTITTEHGSCTGTIWTICEWQAKYQGSYPATITCAEDATLGADLRTMEAAFVEHDDCPYCDPDLWLCINLDDADEPSPLLRALMAEFGPPKVGPQDSGACRYTWTVWP